MKTFARLFSPLFLLLLSHSVMTAQQDLTLGGEISIQNSKHNTGKREFVSGASVSALSAVPTTTDINGQFRLVFSDVPSGTPVRLTVKSDGLEVVNKKDLTDAAVLGRIPLLKIYMCKAGELDARIAEYYNFSVEAYTKGYREKTAALGKKIDQLEKEVQQGQKKETELRATRDAYALLEDQYKKALEDANKLAEQFALVNLDDESKLYVTALDTFVKGYVREAITLLESVNLAKRLADNTANVQKGENIIKQTQAAVSESKQQIEADIRAAVLLAQMYSTQFETDTASFYYELAIRYDSTNVDNISQYADFLQEFKRYDKALSWLNRLIAMPDVGMYTKAVAYGQTGEIYQEIGQIPNAEKAYKTYNRSIEELYRDNPKSESLKNGLAISYSKLGDIYQAQGNFDEALRFFVKQTQLFEELYRDNPDNMELWFGLGVAYFKLGEFHENIGDLEKSVKSYREAANVFKEMYDKFRLQKYADIYLYIENKVKQLLNR